jgi:C1A family cysteine protease
MTGFATGWIVDGTDDRDYYLDTVISKLPPQEIETQGKNIRLERALFAEDDNSPILKRALRLVSEEEWNAKRRRYNQPHYLLLPLVKNKKYKKHLASLQNQDLFLPESVDLRKWFSPVKDQKDIPSCTACAGVALMEYFQNRMNGNINENLDKKEEDNQSEQNSEQDSQSKQDIFSWMFVHKVTSQLVSLTNQETESQEVKGATIRDTLKAMKLFGVAPEKCFNSSEKTLNDEPSAFCYAYAQNYQATHYFRLDIHDEYQKSQDELLKIRQVLIVQIRIALAAGFPAIFGFSDAEILKKNVIDNDKIKENPDNNKKLGEVAAVKINNSKNQEGHALVAVGYNDNKEFTNPDKSKETLNGAFLVRNSWGEWGDKGYGWLPYYYVEQGLATNWWSLLNTEWIDFRGFGLEINESLILSLSRLCQCGKRGCPKKPPGCIP